jgi:hypothetical protein
VVTTSFRPDGQLSARDFHNSDGSIAHSRWVYDDAGRLAESNFQLGDGLIDRTVFSYDDTGRHVSTAHVSYDGTRTESEICTYDAAGWKTKVRFLNFAGRPVAGYGIEGSEGAYPAPGATTMTTSYDERDLPSQVVFQDANGDIVTQVTFARDGAGRILSDEMRLTGQSPFAEVIEKAAPEDRERISAFIAKVWGESFTATTYTYDAGGRMVERLRRMGTLGEERTTSRYEDRDDPVEGVTEHRNREAGLDENGAVQYTPDKVSVSHNRFEYVYDAQGNWTERIVSHRMEPNPDFQRSNIERRALTYYT